MGTQLLPDMTNWSGVLCFVSRPSMAHPSKGFSFIVRLLLSIFTCPTEKHMNTIKRGEQATLVMRGVGENVICVGVWL